MWVSRLATIVAVCATTSAGLVGVAASAPAAPACDVATLNARLAPSDGVVTTAAVNDTGRFTPPGQPALTGLPAFCDVTVGKKDGAGNRIGVEVWLPAAGWQGRFQGVGGGGFSCGVNYGSLAAGLRLGYATASTDCGVPNSSALDGSFALTSTGRLNWPLITDFASVGIHDMTVSGKAVTSAYYRSAPSYAYFTGCSTGGREGLMEAQRYPSDYNGIVSGAPAINWTEFIPAELWPELVMKQANDFLPTCKQQAFTAAVTKACDGLDGVTDGVIANLAACHWDARQLVGTNTPCGTITATDAKVMDQIWQGPPQWFGLERGTSLAGIAGTVTAGDGTTSGAPFPIALSYLGTWVQQNPNWDWTTLTGQQFDRLFTRSVAEFSSTIATNNPNLSAFHAHGGKILIWHGLSDQLIFPQGTVDYYQRLGNASDFARLFLAPGAQHCVSAAGPAPTDPLAAVVSWVEHGSAPSSIPTGGRPLCAYPKVARYTGGDPTAATSYTCARSY